MVVVNIRKGTNPPASITLPKPPAEPEYTEVIPPVAEELTSPYDQVKYSELSQPHKLLVHYLKSLNIGEAIVDSKGDVFLYYRNTEDGPYQIPAKGIPNGT